MVLFYRRENQKSKRIRQLFKNNELVSYKNSHFNEKIHFEYSSIHEYILIVEREYILIVERMNTYLLGLCSLENHIYF